MMHYCQISDDCSKCDFPFCPYEKYGQDWTDSDEEEYEEDEDEEEGW